MKVKKLLLLVFTIEILVIFCIVFNLFECNVLGIILCGVLFVLGWFRTKELPKKKPFKLFNNVVIYNINILLVVIICVINGFLYNDLFVTTLEQIHYFMFCFIFLSSVSFGCSFPKK